MISGSLLAAHRAILAMMSPWLALVAVVGGIYLATAWLWISAMPSSLGADLLLLARAGGRLLAGDSLYPDPGAAAFAAADPSSFYGPPALAVLSAPLAAFDEPMIRLAAFPVAWGLVALAYGFLARAARLQRDQVAAGLVGLLLSFAVFGSATLGASSLLVLVAGAGAALALVRGRDLAAGLLIGTVAALRLYPLVLLVVLIVAGRRRALACAIGAFTAWTILGLLIGGPEATRSYIELAARLATAEGGTSNVALTGSLRPVSILFGACTLAVAGRGIRMSREPAMIVLWWGLALAGMLLLAPIVWDHYLTALIPLVVGLMATLQRAWPGLLAAGMTTAAYSGGLAIVWLPILGLAIAARRLQRKSPTP